MHAMRRSGWRMESQGLLFVVNARPRCGRCGKLSLPYRPRSSRLTPRAQPRLSLGCKVQHQIFRPLVESVIVALHSPTWRLSSQTAGGLSESSSIAPEQFFRPTPRRRFHNPPFVF